VFEAKQHSHNEIAKSLRDKVFTDSFEIIERICTILNYTFSSTEEQYSNNSRQNTSLLDSLDDLDVK